MSSFYKTYTLSTLLLYYAQYKIYPKLETVGQDNDKTNNIKVEVLIFSSHRPMDHPVCPLQYVCSLPYPLTYTHVKDIELDGSLFMK